MLDAFFEAIFSDKSIKLRALDELRRASKGNDYLFADADQTAAVTNGAAVVVTGLDAAAIHAAVAAFAVGEKGGEAREVLDLSGVFVIRTPRARFPNGVSYWIEPGSEGTRVSLYSWSVYGRRDFGVNEAYVKALAARLGQL